MEYAATCSEAAHRLASGLSDRQVDVFVNAVIALVEPVDEVIGLISSRFLGAFSNGLGSSQSAFDHSLAGILGRQRKGALKHLENFMFQTKFVKKVMSQ